MVVVAEEGNMREKARGVDGEWEGRWEEGRRVVKPSLNRRPEWRQA